MTTRAQLIKARLAVLALAAELDNISLAYKRAGISKSHRCNIKAAYQKYGAEGLAPEPRPRARMRSQTPPELGQRIH